MCNHIKTKGILPLTAGGNKSGQQLRKRAGASLAFVNHHQADELSPCAVPIALAVVQQSTLTRVIRPKPTGQLRCLMVNTSLNVLLDKGQKRLQPAALCLPRTVSRYTVGTAVSQPTGHSLVVPEMWGGPAQMSSAVVLFGAQGLLHTQSGKANERKSEKFNLV